MTSETLLFLFLAAFAVTTAVLVVLQRNPVMSAICLIGNFFALAALYLLLHAQLLAVLQIVVYTGAIMVLVIFVIMLLNLGDEEHLRARVNVPAALGVTFALGFLLEILTILLPRTFGNAEGARQVSADVGSVESMGSVLFTRFLLPFEMTSLLLLGAIIGAVILARRLPTR